MKISTLCGLASASLAIAATAGTASAHFITYNSIDSFLTEESSMLREDLATSSADNAPRQFSSLTFDHMTISTGAQALSVWDRPFGAAFATEGDQYIHVAANGMVVTIDFLAPVVRFGMHISDWGEWGVGSLWYSDNLGNHHTIAHTSQTNGNLMFFGMESGTGVSQIVLERDNLLAGGVQHDGFGLDNFYYEISSVPAPGTLAVLGLMGLVGARRRRG